MSPSRLLGLTVAGLATTGLGLVAASIPAQADTTVSKTVAYTCFTRVQFDPNTPLDLGDYAFGVTVDFTVPDLKAGDTVPETPVGIKLKVDDGLHTALLSLFRGQTVTGSSDDAALEVRAGGTSKNYKINGLSVTDQPIEQDPAKPWIISINGTSPTIPVPETSSVDLLAPKQFTIASSVFSPADPVADPGSIDRDIVVNLDCTADSDTERVLSTLAVAAAPTPDPNDDPTTDPTDDPTTDPTTDPTDEPTVAPTTGVNDGGAALDGGVQPISTTASNDALPNTGAPEQLGAIAALGGALVLGGAVLARRRNAMIARHKA